MENGKGKSFIMHKKHTRFNKKKHFKDSITLKKSIKHKTRSALLNKVSIGHLNLHLIREIVTFLNTHEIKY